MAHGSGGRATSQLIADIFARNFNNEVLSRMEDSAVVPGSGRIAVTTDSFVAVSYTHLLCCEPHFFSGRGYRQAFRMRNGERSADERRTAQIPDLRIHY